MQRGLIKHNFYLFEGVNAYREGNRIPPNALYYAENSRFRGGRWGSRKGYTAFGSALSSGTNIKGLDEYERFPSGASTPYLMAYYNSQFTRFNLDDPTTTNTITTTGWSGGDIEVEATSYNGAFYAVNGSDLIGKVADTTWSIVADSPRARLIAEWANKLWAVDNVAPATLQYTATATASAPSNIEDWTGAGSGAQLLGKGGRVESLRTLDKKLYSFKKDQIDVFANFYTDAAVPVPNVEPLSKKIGAMNHRGTAIIENDIWFVAPDLTIRSMGQEAGYADDPRTADLSYVIERHKRDLDSDQSGAVMWYQDKIVKVALKENGSNQNNLLFTYDLDAGGWGFDRATSPQVACTVDGKSFFGVGGNSGQIYRDENGYSDNGLPMSWGGKTGLVDDGQADISKYARYMYVRGARSAGVVITAYLLGEDFERLTGETHTITQPTDAEIAAGSVAVDDDWGPPGDIVGGGGYTGGEPGAPAVYRFNRTFSLGSKNTMFGVEFESSISGQRIFIDEVKLKYIPLGDQYTPVDA